ncbi:uncharacterized protein LOC123544915 isoform X2 [Mercenaria mercenaria]|nr:uncharacterized protein LOC123544915 isoform X2 [Mercenaria mercenaria]XP_045187006.1 uncharacterized protein LOC123544915 isoform X2 [Mercenaria mercenaria]
MQNLCGIRLEGLDFNLVEATLASIETKSLTPIIKEELKLKIQTQRLAAGKTELPKPVFKEPEKCKLTPEEEQKRDHRRERNRIAAAKCRNKRKSVSENLKTSLAEEELKNYTLKRKIEELEKEKHKVLEKLKIQQAFTGYPAANSPSPPKQLTPGKHSPSPLPTPSPPPPSLPLTREAFATFIDMPSTSSGIFRQDNFPVVPRRYSEDVPRNLGSLNYQPRRFSADSNFRSCSTHQQVETANMAAAQTFDNFDQTITCSENQASTLQGSEIDFLSDEEFFRFENETIPFEQYQSVMQPNQSLPHNDSGNIITTDGFRRDTKADQVINENEVNEKIGLEEYHAFDRYLVPLIPVFEDEATVPECNEADRFGVTPGPTSPTFY